jgi:hypothetical protein
MFRSFKRLDARGSSRRGYDDLVFRDCKVFISASNPANNPNKGPAIVRATLDGNFVDVKPVLAGNAEALDIPTDPGCQAVPDRPGE